MSAKSKPTARDRLVRWLFATFFIFGATACAVTVFALLFPRVQVDLVWRLNPEAQVRFQQLGRDLSVLLMLMVGVACGSAAFGRAKSRPRGRALAMVILAVNLLGDTANAIFRHDPRTLIGLPIAGAMIFYLWRHPRR